MSLSRSTALSFGIPTAAVLGAAGLLRAVCPAGCMSCEACVTALAPAGVSAAAVAGILAAPLATRRSRAAAKAEARPAEPGCDPSTATDGSVVRTQPGQPDSSRTET